MSFLKPDSPKDILIHIAAISFTVLLLTLGVFYTWLPSITNHGETITVPDIKGMEYKELANFLSKRNLRYEVTKDSGYSAELPPLSVLRQLPKPNAKVKENRKVYITLNTEKPPMIKMPELEDLSLKAAQMVLRSYELKLGEIEFVPDPIAFGTVHGAKINGRVVLEGERVEKGSIIDLEVGDGYGNQEFPSPALIGLELEEAKAVILGSGLKVRNITPTKKSMAVLEEKDKSGNLISYYKPVGPGEIQKQFPKEGTNLNIGDVIDLWIYKPDPTGIGTTILDND